MRAIAVASLALIVGACSLVANLGPEPRAMDGDAGVGGADANVDVASSDASGDAASGNAPIVGGCRIYPPDNPWNRDVSNDPVDTDAMTAIFPNMNLAAPMHADWGDNVDGYGVPFDVSHATPVPVTFTDAFKPQSDLLACPGGAGENCYPIPPDAKLETGLLPHVLVLDTTGAPNDCTLYELFGAAKDDAGTGWSAGHGAVFHLGSNALRPDGFISTDQAGLPVMPGLVKFEETASGEIKHAIRFTMKNTQKAYIHPATHGTGMVDSGLPPFGLRVRLKTSVKVDSFTGLARVLVVAMQKYGLILADNGTDWYITGERNDGWSVVLDDIVTQLRGIHGSDFEIVKSDVVMTTGL